MPNQMVKEILLGQERIDEERNEKREEIKQLVSMVVGLVSRKEVHSRRRRDDGLLRIKSDNFDWCIDFGRRGEEVRIDFFRKNETGKYWQLSQILGSGLENLSLFEIRRIHGGLGDFLDGMIEKFPSLMKDLQPFITVGQGLVLREK